MNDMNTASDCHVSVISEIFFLMRHFWGVTTSFYATTLNVTTLNVTTLYIDFLKRKTN